MSEASEARPNLLEFELERKPQMDFTKIVLVRKHDGSTAVLATGKDAAGNLVNGFIDSVDRSDLAKSLETLAALMEAPQEVAENSSVKTARNVHAGTSGHIKA